LAVVSEAFNLTVCGTIILKTSEHPFSI